jgi:hypothetical protein
MDKTKRLFFVLLALALIACSYSLIHLNFKEANVHSARYKRRQAVSVINLLVAFYSLVRASEG